MAKANVVLVGFMGTGKTAVGRVLAEKLDKTLVDMDSMIEAREGKSIPRIFAEDGEPHFRALERKLVRELAAGRDLVVSAGGGIVLNGANIDDFSRTGLVVCLTATPATILERVGDDTNRPLLAAADKLGKIKTLLAARKPYYDAVACRVATDGKTPDQIAAEIIKAYESA
ncbi:MAG: shikimate kinase [Kiritimatiellae bacterium]|nr:shikimate kinase [Kiritimatiellia bacterium]